MSNQSSRRPGALGCIGILVAFWLLGQLFSRLGNVQQPKGPYQPAVGHLRTGAKLYTGNLPEPTLIGTIENPLGRDAAGQRVVGVRWPSGDLTWISRDQIIGSEGAYWVRKDGPELGR